jgi:hypothetical protein
VYAAWQKAVETYNTAVYDLAVDCQGFIEEHSVDLLA